MHQRILRVIKKVIFFSLSSVFFVGFDQEITLAAPAITSANISGNTVTISGTGFGTHADWGGSQTFLNKAWSNFDGGNLNGGNLGIGAYPENWSVQTSANRTNSSYYAEKRAVNGELGSLSADQSGSPTEWYISFWFRMPPNTQSGKFLRIYGGSYNIYLSTGCDDTMIRAYCEGCSGATQWGSAVSFGNSTWKKFEFLMDESPLTATTWINGVEGWSRPDLTHAGWGANGHTIDIGNMIDDASRGCGTAGAYQYDDVFINHTRARVEISTASTYSLTANREPQLPTAWSSSSISAQLNRSGYADGTYYLYVIDSTGAVNTTGYPITIGSGGGGDTTPPTSPTNLAATSPSTSSISVSWTASTDAVGVTGYIVERCQGSGCSNFAQVGTPTASPFVDSGLTANTFYNYHVRARDAANNLSGWSNVVGATTQSASSAATRIFFDGSESGNTNLWSQDGSRDKCTSVTSAADGVTGPYAGSRMIRCNSNGTVEWNTPGSFETLVLTSYPYSNEFFFRVRVRVDQNHVRTTGSPKKLLRFFTGSVDYFSSIFGSGPGLKNEGPITSGSYWGDTSGDGTSLSSKWGKVEIYYNSSTRNLKQWNDGVLVRNDTTGSLGSWYPFYLTSNFSDSHDAVNYVYFDEFEIFSDSSSGTATTGSMSNATIQASGGSGDTTPPTSPTNLAATSPSQTSISVSWTASTDAVGVTGYIVERCQGSGCSTFTQVGTPTASPFVDSGLTANTFYNYHVRARDAANNLSGWSNVVGTTTQSATPVTTLTIDNTDTTTSHSGSWSPSTNFPGYYGTDYHYSPNATGHWFEWNASTLSPGTYEVSAYWNANPDRPTDVSYLITHSGGTATRNNINQTQNGSQWNLLGTYTFGTTGTVRVQSGGTGTEGTVADAIRFVKTNTVACNTVTTSNFSQSAYNSYGAPFDAFQTSTNLMNTQCNSADTHTINLTTGVTGDTTRIIYTKGYWYDAVTTAWRQYTGTCTGALNGEWCQGSVSATITDANVSTANAANPTYLVGMTCSVQGGSWKCGCRDTSCSNFYWQVQGAGM